MAKLIKFSEIFKYLAHPHTDFTKSKYPVDIYFILSILKVYVLFFFLAGMSGMLLNFFLSENIHHQFTNQLSNNQIKSQIGNPGLFIFIIGIISPIFEEITFRLFLTKFRKNIAIISISMIWGVLLLEVMEEFQLLFYFKDLLFFDLTMIFYVLCFGSPIYLLLKYVVNERFINSLWEKYYPYIFYSSSILFAFWHIQALNINASNIVFLPFAILPYFILGLFYAYVRVRYGLIWSIIMHILNNMPTIFLSYHILMN